MNVSRETIIAQVDEWARDNIGRDFTFRDFQKEKIIDIVENIVSKKENHNHTIEAPTGSGKSIMIIVSAGVLSHYYSMTSYILCSDLFLFSQYEKFIEDHPNIKFGMLKGQTGNYQCMMNQEDMRNADCRMAQISWASLFNPDKAVDLGYPCALECEYVKARKKAVKSTVTLMTYQLFLYSMYLDKKSDHGQSAFKQRDIVFCDECHNIPDIIQSKFSPSYNPTTIEKLMTIYYAAVNKNMQLFDDVDCNITSKYTEQELNGKLNDIYFRLGKPDNSKTEDYDIVNELLKIYEDFGLTADMLENEIGQAKRKGKILSKDEIKVYKTISFYRNQMCYWGDLFRAIGSIANGQDYLLKKIDEDEVTKTKNITFSCVKEDWLIYCYLLSEASWKVMTSATVGGKLAFEENIGTKYTQDGCMKFDRVPSTFDFTKSPVYFLNRYKMSFREKDKSFESLKPVIFNICKKFEGQRGIIQTGSYELAKKLMFYAPKEIQDRLLMYNGSKEKISMVNEHKMRDDSILIGPTLAEGVDLPDDLCRFIIILKVPYPNMKDQLVKEKIKLFPLWYNSKTSNSIIQGIGRGVRNNHDYCETYILDACFYNLYLNTKDQYSKELQDRIIIYN